ncbi:hypothetical protein BAZ12_10610 [Elizabethkingia miricola]|uniref:Type VI secretion system transmembrane protein TssO n=1 Tax=Elizabethkingia miricola TaxID=172045 RepID=A0ABD4DNS9_ELIMR|nr:MULTISPECIES: type VI secretion system TssO [Elizabethkingia]KUY20411.1 hypothetical protein ATB95_05735 [Elizabethkingia miricola]MCL1653408.1 type VI secretion system transmembrane protein TssO [Elizabethkingia miricola]OPC70238.1 hypothetical protein BAZ12_10610 [Elizabethkingia miricola]OPC74167.1 hypothetical protein BAZ13_03875 [Elizabethkingia miricola]QCO45346.1 hypothetical protein FCS00_02785 [Elizabethkingia sp. 2-6]
MQFQVTLSKKEKRYYFVYLFGMLLLAVVFLGIIFLNKLESPFTHSDVLAIKTLQEKSIFNNRQQAIQPTIDSTFIKLKKLSSENQQPVEENELKYDINDIKNAFSDITSVDARKDNYAQIAKFYKMYYDDKKIIVKKNENVKTFTKQYEECTIGMKDMQQQIKQRKNAQIISNRN